MLPPPVDEGNRRSRAIRFGKRVSVWVDIVDEAVVLVLGRNRTYAVVVELVDGGGERTMINQPTGI